MKKSKKRGKLKRKQEDLLGSEGRKQYEVDEDRMMNEGQSGGRVIHHRGSRTIEEAHEIRKQART